jgi:hypothetical protein
MAERSEEPNLDEVMVPTERPHPDHRAHAKADKHLDDDELPRRTEHEREVIHHEQSGSE